MLKHPKHLQPTIFEAKFPLIEMIDEEDELVQIADYIIQWNDIDTIYSKQFPSETGNTAYSSRFVFGILWLQRRFGLPDRDMVNQLSQNAVYQYFCGFEYFSKDHTCDSSSLTIFRKRFPDDLMNEIQNKHFITHDNDDDSSSSSGTSSEEETENESTQKAEDNKLEGTLIIDATCFPQDIKYPTDINLLNHSCEWAEAIIDILYKNNGPLKGKHKPRTKRKSRRKSYLNYVKNMKRRNPDLLRQSKKVQLKCLKRDLDIIDQYLQKDQNVLDSLPPVARRRLETIRIVYVQQKKMLDENTTQVEDRIVSLQQPYIRPINRGKAKAKTEFGAKVAMSVVNGYCFADKIDFSAFNEGSHQEFIQVVELYKERFGHYPERILADKLYGNKKNRAWCKERGIHLSAQKLGRPAAHMTDERRQYLKETGERNIVEGRFGTCKRKLGMNLIMTKLEETTKGTIQLGFFVMNCRIKQQRLFAAA